MSVVMARIDNRLLHGIIVTQWAPVSGATRVMVIDDKVAGDEVLKSTMRMARPAGMAVSIISEQTALKKQREEILQSSADAERICTRMKQAEQAIEDTASTITEWNENAVRQIVERVTVLSADEVLVRIKGGAEIRQRLE